MSSVNDKLDDYAANLESFLIRHSTLDKLLLIEAICTFLLVWSTLIVWTVALFCTGDWWLGTATIFMVHLPMLIAMGFTGDRL